VPQGIAILLQRLLAGRVTIADVQAAADAAFRPTSLWSGAVKIVEYYPHENPRFADLECPKTCSVINQREHYDELYRLQS
jgi:hypothetical protein